MVVKKKPFPFGSGAPGLNHVGVPLLVHHDPEADALDERLEVGPQLIGGPHPPPTVSEGHRKAKYTKKKKPPHNTNWIRSSCRAGANEILRLKGENPPPATGGIRPPETGRENQAPG